MRVAASAIVQTTQNHALIHLSPAFKSLQAKSCHVKAALKSRISLVIGNNPSPTSVASHLNDSFQASQSLTKLQAISQINHIFKPPLTIQEPGTLEIALSNLTHNHSRGHKIHLVILILFSVGRLCVSYNQFIFHKLFSSPEFIQLFNFNISSSIF
jgi:hypothetical protein